MGWHVVVNAISFGNVMYDTDDLSAIRGASWAMLAICDNLAAALRAALGNGFTVEEVSAGASRAHLCVKAQDPSATEAMLQQTLDEVLSGGNASANGAFNEAEPGLASLLPHLVFSRSVDADEATARRSCAIAQYQMMDVALPAMVDKAQSKARLEQDAKDKGTGRSDPSRAMQLADEGQPCTKDRVRPIFRLGWRAARNDETTSQPMRDVPVSASFFARHEFGRTGRRPRFYKSQAGIGLETCCSLADSFEEIVEKPPPGLPVTVRNKMCVLYMDGNAFGRIRQDWLANESGDAAGFSRAISGTRKALLKGLVDYFCEDGQEGWLRVCPQKKYLENGKQRTMPALRFETLMWGADESVFVFPGWAYPAVMSKLAQLLDDPQCGRITMPDDSTRTLSYAIGVAIGHYKTPIRAMKALAGQLADSAKARAKALAKNNGGELQSLVDAMVLGGIDLPVRPLVAERRAIHGLDEEKQQIIFNMPLAQLPAIMQRLEAIRGEAGNRDAGVPRAKLASILQQAINEGQLGDRSPDVLAELGALLESREGGARSDLQDTLFGWCEDAPLAPLVHLMALWNMLGTMPLPQALPQEEASS